MKTLKDLGFKKNWTYETIVTCFSDALQPHASTYAVSSPDLEMIVIDIYEGSKSLKYISSNSDFVINLVSDPVIFYRVLYDKDSLEFIKPDNVNAPVFSGVNAYIEAKMIESNEKKYKQLLRAETVNIYCDREPALINRAEHLLMESIITSTRIHLFPEGKPEEILRENHRIIKKVAPNSRCSRTMKNLMEKCGFKG